MGARIPVPLAVLLPCLAVCLTASGAVAVGFAAVSGTSGYLMRQADEDVLVCAGNLLSHGLVTVPGSVPPRQVTPCGVELLSPGGQVVVPAAAGAAIPPGRRWLAAHLAQPVTVPGGWRVLVTAVRYQASRIPYVYGPNDMRYVISGPAGPGQAGLAVVAAGLAGTGRVAADYAATAGVVLALLAGAALAAARVIVRPLRQGAAQGRWPPGTALTKISAHFSASRAAEAAARQSAEEMSGRLGEVTLELRTSVNVVRGFAQYCRQRGTPPRASLDQMMRRIAGEVTWMNTLLQRLEAPGSRAVSASREEAVSASREEAVSASREETAWPASQGRAAPPVSCNPRAAGGNDSSRHQHRGRRSA